MNKVEVANEVVNKSSNLINKTKLQVTKNPSKVINKTKVKVTKKASNVINTTEAEVTKKPSKEINKTEILAVIIAICRFMLTDTLARTIVFLMGVGGKRVGGGGMPSFSSTSS